MLVEPSLPKQGCKRPAATVPLSSSCNLIVTVPPRAAATTTTTMTSTSTFTTTTTAAAGAAATQCILPTATAAATAAIARSFKLCKRVGHESFKVVASATRPKMATARLQSLETAAERVREIVSGKQKATPKPHTKPQTSPKHRLNLPYRLEFLRLGMPARSMSGAAW